MEQALRAIVEEFVQELLALLQTIPKEQPKPNEDNLDEFFSTIRPSLLYKRLTVSQVEGHKEIIKALRKHDVPLSHAAYVLATAYHETAHKMQPVREGLNASDTWRKKNLRYYPWYGRGHVQLTWKENYVKADQRLGLGGMLVKDADLALDPEISSEVLVVGSVEGWFSGDKKGRHTLTRHLPNGNQATRAQFKQARRIINIMDKADMIAGYAMIYQDALKKMGY